MKNKDLLALVEDKIVKKKGLSIVKRRIPLKHNFLKSLEAKMHVKRFNGLVFFYRYFETRFDLNRGDVFTVYFDRGCGNELEGPHFAVALLKSEPNNQMVTIVPLHSEKEDRELNPASEILIGEIPGVTNSKRAVAMINQIRTIDKRRLFDKGTIEHFDRYLHGEFAENYVVIPVQNKYIYRLTSEQMNRIHIAVIQYVSKGYIKH